MTEILTAIFPYAAAIVAAIGALVIAYTKGKASEQNNQREREQAAVRDAKQVRDEIDSESDAAVRDRARSWLRDNER
jgi:gas vesicle protein